MMSLSNTEANIINYLYTQSKELYAVEIARKLDIKKRTIYDALDSLTQKGIIEEQVRGQMRFYKLTEKWKEVAKAAKIITETGEAPLLSEFIEKTAILAKKETEILEQIGGKEILLPELRQKINALTGEEKNLDKRFERRKAELRKELGIIVGTPHLAAFRSIESFDDLATGLSFREQERFSEEVKLLLDKINSLVERREKLKLAINGLARLHSGRQIDADGYKRKKSQYERKLRIINDFTEKVKELLV